MSKEKLWPRQQSFVSAARLVMNHAKPKLKLLSPTHFSGTHNMDTLDNTEWDVLIVDTGLQQSLLALYVIAAR
jgi:hypothetical protein